MLQQRIITSLIGLPILVLVIWFGNLPFALTLVLMSIIGIMEFYHMANNLKIQPSRYFGIFTSVLLIVANYFQDANIIKTSVITLATAISLVWLIFRSPREQAFTNWSWTMAGILYIGWTLGYWINLRNLDMGKEWAYWIILTIMASDIFAYLIGSIWGKHRLAPTISPKKSWEGACGGFLASIIIAIILGILFSLPLTYLHMILLAIIINISAQLGDLVESLLKRNTGVKDSGKLLPGHGGLLDRIDSYILTGAIAYLYISYFVHS